MIPIMIVVVVLALIMAALFFYSKQKFEDLEIQLDEAEKNMEIYLEKKMELLDRFIKHMKKKRIKREFPDVLTYKKEKMDQLKTHSELFDIYTEVIQFVDEQEEKINDEKSISLLDQLSDNEDDLIATIKYYNDKATDFNYLCYHFPTSLMRHFLKYQTLELYRNERRETFEILKEK